MYANIANNTFSYLLTLDDFRKNYPEEFKPSWIKITTITMVSSFTHEIDIPKLREAFTKADTLNLRMRGSKTEEFFKWSLKPTTFYNQITLVYRDTYSTKSIKVFPNGSIQVAGCSDLFDCKRIITALSRVFKEFLGMGSIAPIESFRVVMINSNFSLNYKLNLLETVKQFEKYQDIFKVSFEPDRYSAVKIKFRPSAEMKEITASIFSTGKIIITGAETLKEIVFGYNVINDCINHCPNIRVAETQEKELFDNFIGYTIGDLITNLRMKGFKSWLLTENNMKINF